MLFQQKGISCAFKLEEVRCLKTIVDYTAAKTPPAHGLFYIMGQPEAKTPGAFSAINPSILHGTLAELRIDENISSYKQPTAGRCPDKHHFKSR